MGLFYAHLKGTEMNYDACKYLLTFVNRETADEWWRMMSTPPSPYAGKVKRISPELYFQHDVHNNGDVIKFYYSTKLPEARQFREKIFTTVVYDSDPKLPIVRPVNITDHISGRWYFIQSKAEPSSRWYLRTRGNCLVCGGAGCGAIHVSSEYRTKFCVRVRNPPDDSEMDLVMIGRDKISIAGPKGYILHIDDTGDLNATRDHQGEIDFVFGDLKHRFIARAEKKVNGEVWEYVESVERGLGEVWELVD